MFVIIVKFSKQQRRLLLDHLLAVADNNALVVLAYSLSRKRDKKAEMYENDCVAFATKLKQKVLK